MRFLSRNALPIGKNSLKAKKGRALPVPRKRNQPPSRRDFIHRQCHGAVHEISAFPDNLQFGRRTLGLYRYRKCNRCSIGRRMKGLLNEPSRYDRPVLLQFENDVQGEIRPRCRSKVSMKRRRVDARLGKRKRAVPRRVRDCRTGRDAVDVKEQRVPRRSGRGRRGIGRKQLRIGRRSRRPRCACRARGARRARDARGSSRTRRARNARCACHSHARCTSGTSNTRGSRRTRGASYARRARNACHSHARWASGTSDARRYGNLWEYMSLFRLSEVVEMFVADKFVIYMYVAGVCLTVLFSDSNKVYQLNTHLPRQRFTSSILF